MSQKSNEVVEGDKVAVYKMPAREGFFGTAEPVYDGMPLRVVVKSHPWLLCENPDGGICTVDLRSITVTKVSEEYWSRFCAHRSRGSFLDRTGGYDVSGKPIDSSDRESGGPKHPCPRCRGPMIERCTATGPWRLVCEECGLSCEGGGS